MTSIRTETETVIKKILPYLSRRGYDVIEDLDFETALNTTDSYSKGYVDILVTLGNRHPAFLIEAKRISKKLSNKDRDQAIGYARTRDVNVPFVVVTNGIDIHCFNTKNKKRILWDGKTADKIPSKQQVRQAIQRLRVSPEETSISLSNDSSLPYRQGLPLRQLNALFYKGHSTIRKIEKDEVFAFSDFSKLLFLRLLEEKNDLEPEFDLPYSYRFHELATYASRSADQVMMAIRSMIDSIKRNTPYGEVLEDNLRLRNPKTFLSLVKDLSSVSFYDCSVDSKGAAFEYYVRATLKGKKLGQYFTPRELVKVMAALVGEEKIINSVISGTEIKVLDPACGTGGFLVFLMQDALGKLDQKKASREITQSTYENAVRKIKRHVFYGSDANEGVAASAKMNMIIAGDGYTNIQHEDSLAKSSTNWNTDRPDCDLILTNPPFGTSEGDSLTSDDLDQYSVSSTKGQYLFLQKMVKCTVSGGEICSVIDEGVLNTDSGKELRKFILQNCKIQAIVNLPSETFKPNKINVRSSLIYMEKRATADLDLEDNYLIPFCCLESLGYSGSGDKIRGFDTHTFLNEIQNIILDHSRGKIRSGYHWTALDISSQELYADTTYRLDFKYWDTETRSEVQRLIAQGSPTIQSLNTIPTNRGKSPSTDCYVDENDGYALVVKAGSNINKFGELVTQDADWIEKSTYEAFLEKAEEEDTNLNIVQKGDVLLSSTGDGTLGKCCVYDIDKPAIADGHVTIIRVKPDVIDPYYLADYLRNGFGAKQVNMLFTGSTGMIELTPVQVDSIVVDTKSSIDEQKSLSKAIRNFEKQYKQRILEADELIESSKSIL